MRLKYSEQQNSDRSTFLPELLIALAVGAVSVAFMISAFGLPWSPSWSHFGNPLKGLLSAWNVVAERLGESEYYILPRFARGYLEGGEPAPQLSFLVCALLLVSLLGYLVLRSGNRWLLLLFLIPSVALMLFTEISPQILPGMAFFGVMLLCFCLMGEAPKFEAEEPAEVEADDGVSRLWGLVLPAAVILVLMAGGMALDHFVGVPSSDLQIKASEAIEDGLHLRYGSNPLGSGRLDRLEGDELSKKRGSMEVAIRQMKNGGEDRTKTALEVTSDDLDAWYLRGFIGEQYSRGAWLPLNNATVFMQRDSLYWMNRQGFDGLSQMEKASLLAGQPQEDRSVGIRVKKADRSLIYLPYEMSGTDRSIPKGTENYGGNYLKSSRIFGSREVAYSAGGNMTGKWTDLVGGLYSAEKDQALDEYYINESHYNRWCYEQYTQVPTRLKTEIYGMIGSPGDISRDHAAYKETIEKVLGAMEKNFIYSEDFERVEKGSDPLEQFLAAGRGCDAHYASLATMMFRCYGIPARYVEGYLLTPGDIKSGGSAEIGLSHAHAWTEIYVDGFGWVPLEATPAYEGIMPQADLDKGLEAVNWENRPQPQAQMPPEEMEDELSETQLGSRLLKIIKWFLLILLLLILLALLIWLIHRHMIIRARRKAFGDPDPRRGICAMYDYMLKSAIPISDNARTIGDLAAFSMLDVHEGLRTMMKKELEKGEDEKKQNDKNTRDTVPDRIAAMLGSMRRGKQ